MILSRSHTIARRLRALRTDPALRAASGVAVAEGVHLAQEALRSGIDIEVAVVAPRLRSTEEGRSLESRLAAHGIAIHQCSDALIQDLQDARSPQPVVLIVRRRRFDLSDVLSESAGTPLLLVACAVQEPGNLGALIRTAEAAGATGFVATPGSASLTHPRTARASMGSIFRVPAIEAGIADVLDAAQAREFRVFGAEAGGGDCESADWTGPVALLLGGEGAGLPPEATARLFARVGVPMADGVESLSVNAAAAVLLFTAARKRRAVSSDG